MSPKKATPKWCQSKQWHNLTITKYWCHSNSKSNLQNINIEQKQIHPDTEWKNESNVKLTQKQTNNSFPNQSELGTKHSTKQIQNEIAQTKNVNLTWNKTYLFRNKACHPRYLSMKWIFIGRLWRINWQIWNLVSIQSKFWS